MAELVALELAVTHCELCLRHHVREAERLGIFRADIHLADGTPGRREPAAWALAWRERLSGSGY